VYFSGKSLGESFAAPVRNLNFCFIGTPEIGVTVIGSVSGGPFVFT
jgi:hypothetical protein